MFLSKIGIIFYIAGAFVLTMPLFFLIASLKQCSLKAARNTTIRFLEAWAKESPHALSLLVRKTVGTTVAFGLLILFAYVLDQAAKLTLPIVAQSRRYYGLCSVKYEFEYATAFSSFEREFASQWKDVKGEDISTDRRKWYDFNSKNGRTQVRAFRLLAVYSIMFMAAGIIDFVRSKFRGRGVALLAIGAFFVVVSARVWADKEARYIENIIQKNTSLDSHAAQVPDRLKSCFPPFSASARDNSGQMTARPAVARLVRPTFQNG